VVLDHTAFYAESGGQVGDRGMLRKDDAAFQVTDTQKQGGGAFAHIGTLVEGSLQLGDVVDAEVDVQRRRDTMLNHTATHLLHAALRTVLGEHVQQKGSLVEPERLRFDFSHFEPVTPDQLETLERMVNEQIRHNAEVQTRIMGLEDAMKSGAMALFGEKYADEVRVLTIGDFSVELCGGTHVSRAGDIGLFKITNETGIASGVRRIEAVTGDRALAYIEETERNLQRIAAAVKGGREDAEAKVVQLLDRSRKLEKELERLQAKLASSQGSDLASQAVDVAGLKVLAAKLEGVDPKSLRDMVDQLKNRLGSAAIVLGVAVNGKVSLVAGVTKDQTGRIKAGDLVNAVAQQVGGKGGGRPDMAMAGGSEPDKLDAALASVADWIRGQVAA
jgi:alanyl-tRNA synthetase